MGKSKDRFRLQSDEICTKVLSGIRFSPVDPQSDLRTDGIHPIGIGGLGYGYWRSPKVMGLQKTIRAFRDISKKDISYVEVQELVSEFLKIHINPLVAGRFDLQSGDGSLIEHLNTDSIEILQEKFFEHISRYVADAWFWVPLNSISVDRFHGSNFVILPKPEDPRVDDNQLENFLSKPILSNANSYLGIRARNLTRASEKSSVVLGAIMLCMYSGTHFRHTMGKPVSGFLNFDDGLTYTSSPQHVPYLSTPISLEAADRDWLTTIDNVLRNEQDNKKVIRSLQWIRSSWFSKGAERFSSICQAIDSVTPSRFNSMQAKCGWIDEHISFDIDANAIQLLFKKLRSDVAHGDAPSLVESNSYLVFLEKYGADPQEAAFEITRQVILENFLPKIIVRPHPLQEHPEALDKMNKMLSRYGMEFTIPSGYNFSMLRPQPET